MTDERPEGLGTAGWSLWSAVVDDYDLSPAEKQVLAVAARQADDVARLEDALAEQGLTVEGSKGQPRLNPIVGELRQGRIALTKMIDSLRLPVDDEPVGRTPASRRAQAAANARWNRVRAADAARDARQRGEG